MDDSKTQKALTRLFLALRNAPENKLPRTSIYERTLNKELTAAELNGLKSHWLVQRFITIEKVKVVTHGPLAELWTLLKSALDYPEELSFVFGQRPEPVDPDLRFDLRAPPRKGRLPKHTERAAQRM